MAAVTIANTRFGDLTVEESAVYAFPEGLPGFAAIRRFALCSPPPVAPFQWLQALDVGPLAFVVCDPRLFFPDYRVGVRATDLDPIRLADVAQGRVLVIVTVRREPEPFTANLLGPLVLNPQERLGRQIVLSESGYSTRQPLVPAAPATP